MYVYYLLALLLANARAEPELVRVQHRVVDPNRPTTPWSLLGTVALPPVHAIPPLGSPATLVPADVLPESADLTGVYQVALERPGVTDAVWPTSVVKACHLHGSTSAHLTIHLSPSGMPFAIDHFVAPVPHDGSCPPRDAPTSYPPFNTSVTLVSPRRPPQPELRTPPQLTAQGEPIAPAPEKTFLQKYWIYLVVILGVLLISGPVDEPAGNGGGQGGR